MALPTREQLNTEVDRRFHEQFPHAPERLDPSDPAQAAWIEVWREIRDEFLNAWTDHIFAGFFPDAGTLDPKNSGDARLIDYWTDIRDQIRDGRPGRYSWDGDPTASQAGFQVTSVDHDPSGGWVVTFDRAVTIDQARQFLWPNGVPDGVQVVADEPEKIHLHGLSIEAVQSMTPEVSGRITPSVLTSDPAGDPTTARHGDPTGAPDATRVDVELDETTKARIAEWTEHVLHGGHALASTAEVTEYLAEAVSHLTGSAGRAAVMAEAVGTVTAVLGPISDALFVIWAGYQVVDAFMSEKRLEKQQGFVYGVMWQALDEPNHLPQFVDGITYSADEHRDAFLEGVAEGRAKAQ